VRRHFSFIKWPSRGSQPPMSWVMERCREAILRTGAKLAIVDPWQEIDLEKPLRYDRNDTHWIGKRLQEWVGFAEDMRCNVMIVVHPSSQRNNRRKDGTYEIPDGYQIGDSQSFYSRCHVGLTVHRPSFERDEMLLRCWKTKDQRVATFGDTMFRYDQLTKRIWPLPVEVDALKDMDEGKWRADLDG
jgi:hypothetical protein